jgi:CheY-like chemotaxis protein
MFAQVERSLDRSQGGLGIGLTLVRTLTQLHGGTVHAESDGPGRGSTFVVRLPALPEREPEAPGGPASAEAPPEVDERPVRLLLVEDHAEGAEMLATLLRLWGHQVRVAVDGPSALVAVEDETPEMILLDLGLPRMNGYEVAERLRVRHGPDTPFLVALTGYGQAEARRRSAESGFDVHLVKPVDPSVLERLLADFRRRRASAPR